MSESSRYDIVACAYCGKQHMRMRCPKCIRDNADALFDAVESLLAEFDAFAGIRKMRSPDRAEVDPPRQARARAALDAARGALR